MKVIIFPPNIFSDSFNQELRNMLQKFASDVYSVRFLVLQCLVSFQVVTMLFHTAYFEEHNPLYKLLIGIGVC